MRKVLLVMLVLLASAGNLLAADNQAYLGIFAETSLMKMPGMPDFSKLLADSGKDMPKMPGMEKFMSMGKPTRNLTVRLWSPGIAPKDAFAYITPPKGLKQGERMDLELYRPESGKATEGGSGDGKDGKHETPKFTIKIYWGSSEKVRPGQPKIITWDKLTPEQVRKMEEQAKRAERGAKGGDYFYKPDWTTGYWPTAKQPGNIAKDASLTGNFALTTSYTGNVAIDVPANVDFLAPIELSSPNLEKPVGLDKFIPFVWKAIPNALGLHATAMGMQGEETLIIWSSAEVETDMSIDWGYLQMAEVADYVKKKMMMDGKATSATIPEGIFKDCDIVMFSMVGYGPGTALDKTQPIPRVQTKTTLTVTPLGGKQAEGMMDGMPGMDDSEQEQIEIPESESSEE